MDVMLGPAGLYVETSPEVKQANLDWMCGFHPQT